MRTTSLTKRLLAAASVALPLAVLGCTKPEATPTSSAEHADEASHDHPTEGPHHGALVELGEEEYHAELVHNDEAQSVVVYLLDSAAKPVTVDAKDVTINLTHDGKPEQFTLSANSDLDETGSKYESTDAELFEDLEHAVGGQLVVTISGKQYRGQLPALDHDHDDDHEEHDDH